MLHYVCVNWCLMLYYKIYCKVLWWVGLLTFWIVSLYFDMHKMLWCITKFTKFHIAWRHSSSATMFHYNIHAGPYCMVTFPSSRCIMVTFVNCFSWIMRLIWNVFVRFHPSMLIEGYIRLHHFSMVLLLNVFCCFTRFNVMFWVPYLINL